MDGIVLRGSKDEAKSSERDRWREGGMDGWKKVGAWFNNEITRGFTRGIMVEQSRPSTSRGKGRITYRILRAVLRNERTKHERKAEEDGWEATYCHVVDSEVTLHLRSLNSDSSRAE